MTAEDRHDEFPPPNVRERLGALAKGAEYVRFVRLDEDVVVLRPAEAGLYGCDSTASEKHDPSPYLDRQQAAEFLRLSVSKIDKLVRSGAIRCIRPGTGTGKRGRIIFARAELVAFMEQHGGK